MTPVLGGSTSHKSHWTETAKRWSRVGHPLRPNPVDIEEFTCIIDEWSSTAGRFPRALILGVTPELCQLPWPDGTIRRAVDNTADMIAAIWPGSPDEVKLGCWTELPFSDSSQDIVVCDGGFHLLSHPESQDRLAAELARVTAPGGLVIFRLFTPPEKRESAAEVLVNLTAGKIASPHALKLCLGQALQATARVGVALHDVWQAVHQVEPDLDALAVRLGWDRDATHTLDAYRDCANRYYFVGAEEFEEIFRGPQGFFRRHALRFPQHVWGQRCPVLALQRTDGQIPFQS